jgi:hypothetical protein
MSEKRCFMRAIPILLAALAVASCDDYHSNKNNKPGVDFQPLSPSATVAAHVSLSPLPIVTTPTLGCPVLAFSTAFNLVVVSTGRNSLSMDHATFRLLDGTNVGGSIVRIPTSELNSLFGSTVVHGSRTFPFGPQFGCRTNRGFSIAGDIRLVDSSGVASTVTVSADF